MKARYVDGYENLVGVTIEHGFLFEEENYASSFMELKELKKQDKAYRIEVSEAADCINILLESENRRIKSEMSKEEAKLSELDGRKSDRPGMPSEYDDPNKALEIYGEHAHSHQDIEGIEVNSLDCTTVLDPDNRDN